MTPCYFLEFKTICLFFYTIIINNGPFLLFFHEWTQFISRNRIKMSWQRLLAVIFFKFTINFICLSNFYKQIYIMNFFHERLHFLNKSNKNVLTMIICDIFLIDRKLDYLDNSDKKILIFTLFVWICSSFHGIN